MLTSKVSGHAHLSDEWCVQIGQHEAPTVQEIQQLFAVFRGLHEADAMRLISACDVWKVPQGQLLLKAGDEPQCMVAVLQV